MNKNLKTKNRKALLLLLAGQLLLASFIGARHVGISDMPDFFQGFGMGAGLMLMISAVIMMARNKRECV